MKEKLGLIQVAIVVAFILFYPVAVVILTGTEAREANRAGDKALYDAATMGQDVTREYVVRSATYPFDCSDYIIKFSTTIHNGIMTISTSSYYQYKYIR